MDIEAISAYLRTGINEGSEVIMPALGQDVFVHVDYLLSGTNAPVSVVVRATVDGVEQCGGEVDLQPNADEVIWCEVPFTATAGAHTLRWELDTQNSVAEANENNNAAEFQFTTAAAGSRDLEAVSAYLRTGMNSGDEVTNPTPGQQVFFHLDYRAAGSGADFSAEISATIDDQPFCNGPITFSLGMEGVIWCPTAWAATAGTHTLHWEIDGDHQINETDENNNVAEATFTVGGTVSCVGDCDDSNAVAVSELVTGVNISLERAEVETCPAFDNDGNGRVTVDELVTGVGNLLHGCQ